MAGSLTTEPAVGRLAAPAKGRLDQPPRGLSGGRGAGGDARRRPVEPLGDDLDLAAVGCDRLAVLTLEHRLQRRDRHRELLLIRLGGGQVPVSYTHLTLPTI